MNQFILREPQGRPKQNPVRILIVDDQQAVRKGLRSILASRPEWNICGEAENGVEAVEKARHLRPDLVLMDISMPRMDGLEATKILRKEAPGSTVVIISQNDPAIAKTQALTADAAAFISKDELVRDLLPTLDGLLMARTMSQAETPLPQWLAARGTLGRLINEYDWSKTPLGAIEKWPQSLKTSVNLMLNSQHPMWVGWGPDVTFLYNDAYIQILSKAKHPTALGKPASEVWSEIWDFCGPLANKVFEKGEASFIDEVRLFMNRGDFLEETYYSFSYSPIRDESGKVAGLFCPSTEVTHKIVNARRLRTLAEVSSNAFLKKTIEAACDSAASAFGRNPDDVPFAALYLIEGENGDGRLRQMRAVPESVGHRIPQSLQLGKNTGHQSVWPLTQVLETHSLQIVSIDTVDGLPMGPAQQALSQAIVLPITSRGEERSVGVLLAGVNPTRKLDSDYLTFFDLLVNQVGAAIQNARAAEEETKRLNALAELDRAKTAFFSNVSHEFRTPLTLMLGPVEDLLARSHTDLPPAAKYQLELVNRNGSRLLRLVNTLLDFSRIEAGRMQAIYQPTDLPAFTAELASVFRSATEKAGLTLELDCPPMSDPVFVDRSMWEKIVLNLISNAFKFTFDGRISISLEQTGRDAELRVQDTGVGIPEKELSRVFNRFYRIEKTRSRTHEGSGIGLALVQELVKLHGGTIRAESKVGEGTTFIVAVPLGTGHLAMERIGNTRSLATTAIGAGPFVEEALRWLPDSEPSTFEEELPYGHELIPVPCPPGSIEQATNRPFIVVADDNADMRQYLVRMLSERYEVQPVGDGQAALEAIRQRIPKLVLSDVMMPNLDGFGLLRELRSDPATKTIPVILLSARAGEEARVEGMEQGADDYLIKPFSARELLARVQTHLQMAQTREQAQESLRESEERFRALVNASSYVVYRMSPDWSEMRQLDGHGFISDTTEPNRNWLHDYVHPDDQASVVQAIQKAVEQKHLFESEHRVRRADGSLGWTLSRAVPLLNVDGEIIEWFGAASDVTARKQAEDSLRKINELTEEQVRARTEELELRNAEVLRQSEQLRQLSQRLLQIQEDERRHIARELHDSAGQTLTALSISLARSAQLAQRDAGELAQEFLDSQELVQQLSQEIRTTSYLLHPPLLEEAGLREALCWYTEGLAERSGLNISLDIPEDIGRFSREVELTLFRLVQECLTNIHRHSGSKTARISVASDAAFVRLEVRDNGSGIAPEKLSEIQTRGSGVGLRGMRERIRQFDGHMEIQSNGDGTTISFELPSAQSSAPKDAAYRQFPMSA